MSKITITFRTKKDKGTKFGGLKVQEYAAPGDAQAPLQAIKLVNGTGTKALKAGSAYTLYYGYYGEPGGTFEMVVTDPAGKKLLEETDTIPDNRLADSGKFTFVT